MVLKVAQTIQPLGMHALAGSGNHDLHDHDHEISETVGIQTALDYFVTFQST